MPLNQYMRLMPMIQVITINYAYNHQIRYRTSSSKPNV